MIYDYDINTIVLGPQFTGKSLFIHTYLNKQMNCMPPTIGVDFHKISLEYNDLFFRLKLWNTGNGLLYKNILIDYLKLSNFFIIIDKTTSYDFILQLSNIIKLSNDIISPNHIIIIHNNYETHDFKYDESYIETLYPNITISFFYIDISSKIQVNRIFDHIKHYIYNLYKTQKFILPQPKQQKQKLLHNHNSCFCCSIC
jgi:hypothetical protein